MKMRKCILLLAFTCLLAAIPAAAHAQTDIQIGPRIGVDIGDFNDLFIGAEARLAIGDFPVVLNPTFDYYFAPTNVTVLSIGANALYPFPLEEQQFTPYAGGGLGVFRQSVPGFSNSEVGLNLVGGAEYPLENVTPYAQAVINVGGAWTAFGLSAGVLLGL